MNNRRRSVDNEDEKGSKISTPNPKPSRDARERGYKFSENRACKEERNIACVYVRMVARGSRKRRKHTTETHGDVFVNNTRNGRRRDDRGSVRPKRAHTVQCGYGTAVSAAMELWERVRDSGDLETVIDACEPNLRTNSAQRRFCVRPVEARKHISTFP